MTEPMNEDSMPEFQRKSQDDILLLFAKSIYSLLNLSYFQGML